MNDFFILNSLTLPNDRDVKIKTNIIFKANIKRKNNNDIFFKNKGIEIEKAEVAITQVNMIIFKLSVGNE